MTKYEELEEVFNFVKTRFKYTPDIELYNRSEFWAVMGDYYKGDCEDFALTCRKLLIVDGWSKSDLVPACCWTETGEYHAVLVAYIGDEAFVLENRQNRVVPWEDLPYRWDKILDRGGKFWVEIKA